MIYRQNSLLCEKKIMDRAGVKIFMAIFLQEASLFGSGTSEMERDKRVFN